MDCPLNLSAICTNWVCSQHGCQRLGGVTLPVTTDTAKWDFQPAPRGCICPPTSEQTCLNPECGRKPRAAMEGK